MQHLFKIVCFIFAVLPCLASAESANINNTNVFDAKIAVVDVESIFEHSKAIIYIKDSINSISAQIESEFSLKEAYLKKQEKELVEKRGVLSKDEFEKLLTKFNKNVSIVQKERQNKKLALERAHSNALSTVHKTTVNIIKTLSEKYGFNVVIPSSQVLFVDNSLNITHEVITNLNESLSQVKVEYNPAILSE
jgi:outer membrane protein